MNRSHPDRGEPAQAVRNLVKIFVHGRRCYAVDSDALRSKPAVAAVVVSALRVLAMSMPVDLDRELRGWAEEVEDVRTDRMLPAKHGLADPSASQPRPEHDFRLRHPAAKHLGPLQRQNRSAHP